MTYFRSIPALVHSLTLILAPILTLTLILTLTVILTLVYIQERSLERSVLSVSKTTYSKLCPSPRLILIPTLILILTHNPNSNPYPYPYPNPNPNHGYPQASRGAS